MIEKISQNLQEKKSPRNTELDKVRKEVWLALENGGFIFDRENRIIPTGAASYIFLEPTLVDHNSISDELFIAVRDALSGLNEITTNYLTNFVLTGEFHDSNPTYSKSFPIPEKFILFIAQELIGRDKQYLTIEKAKEYVIKLFAELALSPRGCDTSSFKLFYLLKLAFPELNSIQNRPQTEITYDLIDTALYLFLKKQSFTKKIQDSGQKSFSLIKQKVAGTFSVDTGEITNIFAEKLSQYKIKASIWGALTGLCFSALHFVNANGSSYNQMALLAAVSLGGFVAGGVSMLGATLDVNNFRLKRIIDVHELIHETSISTLIKDQVLLSKLGLYRFQCEL